MLQGFRTKGRKWIALVIGGALLGFGAFYLSQEARQPRKVAVEQLQEGPVSLVLALNGRLEPAHNVNISPAVTAYVARVLVQEGDRVAQGQLLVELEAGLVQAQLAQAQAALDVQLARRDQAAAAAKRADTLGTSAISRSDREGAETALATAIGEVDRQRAALQEVNRQLERYSLRAPIEGVILSRNVEAGQLVGTQDIVMLLAKPDDPLVEADVDELYAGQILLQQKALLRPVGLNDTLQGEVAFIAPRIDPATGGRKVKIRFDHSPQGLPFGLTVTTNIIVEEHEGRLSLPRSALTDNGTVFVLQEGRAVEKRPDYVSWPADRLLLRAGLSAGDVVILDPDDIRAGDELAVAE